MQQIYFSDFKKKSINELNDFCTENHLNQCSGRQNILCEIMRFIHNHHPHAVFDGFLEITNNSYGVLRDVYNNFLNTPYDLYVHPKIINDYALRSGDYIECEISAPKTDDQKFFYVNKVLLVNHQSPSTKRLLFEDLTAIFPSEEIKLESEMLSNQSNAICRVLDLMCPLGFGQRSLIVAPPKSGKTTILHAITCSMLQNYPDAKLIILLIGERPEEVTQIKSIAPNAEIVFSTFDESCENQVKTSEMVKRRAERLVELGQKVIILMDSITRLVRAYNHVVPSSGRVLTGGIEPGAMYKPKKFFGSARNTKEGGSLMIIATCLVETGSKMDDFIFEEMKGTGKSEIRLSRSISEKRVFPAINVLESSTRRIDLFIPEDKVRKLNAISSFLASMDILEAAKFINERIRLTKNNKLLLIGLQGPSMS